MMFIDKKQGKFVTPLFWLCKCEDEFVHPASDRYCWACQTPQEDGKPAPVKWVLENKNALRRFTVVELVESAIIHELEGLDGEMELRYLAEAIPF